MLYTHGFVDCGNNDGKIRLSDCWAELEELLSEAAGMFKIRSIYGSRYVMNLTRIAVNYQIILPLNWEVPHGNNTT